MALRRDDACSRCTTSLAAGTRAQWDPVTRSVTCLACIRIVSADLSGPASSSNTAVAVSSVVHDGGAAGTSARKEYERREAKRAQRLEDKWGAGRMGRLATFFSLEPQSTTAWAQGAAGEQRVAAILVERLGNRAVLLNDRKVPRTRGNIDHIVVAASGVWVVDAKRYTGKVEQRNVGGMFRPDVRLFVGGRDRTKTVAGLGWQVEAVRTALDDLAVPVQPSLSFVGAQWPVFFAKPFRFDGVWVSWPARLAELMLTGGPLTDEQIREVALRLAARLPAN